MTDYSESTRTSLRWLGLALLTALSLAVRGYEFGVSDQNLYLPFLERWNAPVLFPTDFLLKTGYTQGSVTWLLLAFLGRLVGYPALFFVLQAASRLLLFAVIYETSLLISRSRLAAWLAVLLWIPAYEIPGAGMMSSDYYFTTRSLGWVLAAAALYFLMADRHRLCAAALAAGVLVHVVSVLPVAAGAALAAIWEKRWKRLAGLAGALIGSAILLALFARGSGLGQGIWTVYRGERLELLWRHVPDLFPEGWAFTEWLGLACCAGAFGILAAASWRSGSGEPPEHRLVLGTAGAAAAGAAGLLGASTGLALLAELSLNRGFAWLLYASVLLASKLLAGALDSRPLRVRALALYLMASWVFGDPATQLLAAASLALLLLPEGATAAFRIGRWSSLAPLGGIVILQVHHLTERPLLHPPEVELALPACAFFTLLACGLWHLAGWEKRSGFLLLPSALAVTWFLFPTAFLVPRLPGGPLLASVSPQLKETVERKAAWDREMAVRWAIEEAVRERIPESATVLVPPQWEEFRTRSLRSPFVLYKDRCGALYSGSFADDWLERMRRIRAIPPGRLDLAQGPLLRPDELRALSRDYRALHLDYAVLPSGLELPHVATAGHWALYDIRAGEPGKDAP